MDTEKTSLEYVPLAIMKSPALLCNVQQQAMEIQRLVHQRDLTYRAIANKDIQNFLHVHEKGNSPLQCDTELMWFTTCLQVNIVHLYLFQ